MLWQEQVSHPTNQHSCLSATIATIATIHKKLLSPYVGCFHKAMAKNKQ
jgi:hypothetical protein